ncbi:MAG: transketolase [Bacteroidia bacterium]|jgi:transketolase|nr:transketolase [Bacteroidia bacterium]
MGQKYSGTDYPLTLAQMDIPTLEKIAAQVRRDAVRMIYQVQSGHPGGALGAADLFVALYFAHMRHTPDPFSPTGDGEDVFILSNGHICASWYAVLARSGYFPIQELSTFRKINSRLQGHPATKEHLPGVRIATGSLGQGLSVAIGIALGKKLKGDPHRVYVMIGDGEANEGQIWEAALFAAHHKVDNLIAILDRNYKQIDGDTREVLSTDPMEDKWRAFGWEVLSLHDPHHFPTILQTLEEARQRSGAGKPLIIIAYTTMGKGVDFMENDYRWHGKAPGPQEFERAIAQLPETLQDF